MNNCSEGLKGDVLLKIGKHLSLAVTQGFINRKKPLARKKKGKKKGAASLLKSAEEHRDLSPYSSAIVCSVVISSTLTEPVSL